MRSAASPRATRYLLDVEPEHVAVELVNRYRAAKRAQLL